MGLFSKKEPKVQESMLGILSTEIPGFPSNAMVNLSIEGENLVLKHIVKKDDTRYARIPLERVLGLEVGTNTEIIEKSKSSVGRGVAGGLIFGPAGLILGAASGIGKKKKEKIKGVAVISYTNKNGEIENILLELGDSLSMMSMNAKKFKKYINTLIVVEKDIEL